MTENQHQDEHRCDDCGRSFETIAGLHQHQGTMHDPPWDDEDRLYELVSEGLSTTDIANELGVSPPTIAKQIGWHVRQSDSEQHPAIEQFGIPASFRDRGDPKEVREPRAVEIIETIRDDYWEDIEIVFRPYWWGSIPAIGTQDQQSSSVEDLLVCAINDLIGMTAGGGGILLREGTRTRFLAEFDYGDQPASIHQGGPIDPARVCEIALEYREVAGADDAYDVLRSIADEKRFRSDATLKTPRSEVSY